MDNLFSGKSIDDIINELRSQVDKEYEEVKASFSRKSENTSTGKSAALSSMDALEKVLAAARELDQQTAEKAESDMSADAYKDLGDEGLCVEGLDDEDLAGIPEKAEDSSEVLATEEDACQTVTLDQIPDEDDTAADAALDAAGSASEEVVAEEVIAEEVKTEEVITEEVKTEEVIAEEVKTEEVITEEVKTEEITEKIAETLENVEADCTETAEEDAAQESAEELADEVATLAAEDIAPEKAEEVELVEESADSVDKEECPVDKVAKTESKSVSGSRFSLGDDFFLQLDEMRNKALALRNSMEGLGTEADELKALVEERKKEVAELDEAILDRKNRLTKLNEVYEKLNVELVDKAEKQMEAMEQSMVSYVSKMMSNFSVSMKTMKEDMLRQVDEIRKVE